MSAACGASLENVDSGRYAGARLKRASRRDGDATPHSALFGPAGLRENSVWPFLQGLALGGRNRLFSLALAVTSRVVVIWTTLRATGGPMICFIHLRHSAFGASALAAEPSVGDGKAPAIQRARLFVLRAWRASGFPTPRCFSGWRWLRHGTEPAADSMVLPSWPLAPLSGLKISANRYWAFGTNNDSVAQVH